MSVKVYNYLLEPRDLLFMRDARPMEASDAGLGANWPRPDQLWNALINAFHRQWPERQAWEGAKHTYRDKKEHLGSKDKNSDTSGRFGALKTVGPFPYHAKEATLYLPTPADWAMELVPCVNSDLPTPLTHGFRARKLGKRSLPQWISVGDYARYLSGKEDGAPAEPDLYTTERNIGIAIDGTTQTTVEGQLYQAEYLRLMRDVGLAFTTSCAITPKGQGDTLVDVFDKFGHRDIVIGGQQGVARLRTQDAELKLPQADITTPYLRWTLVTPALFTTGWLPGWCKDSRQLPEAEKAPLGTVMLKGAKAKLIAARIDKPLSFSGWDLQAKQPKPTQLGVAAGACFVFDCGSVESAKNLAQQLQHTPRSDLYGEKGFGIGICSSITPKSEFH